MTSTQQKLLAAVGILSGVKDDLTKSYAKLVDVSNLLLVIEAEMRKERRDD